MAIRVVLADDHPMVRAGIRNILERAEGIQVVGEAADGGQALELARELKPDVLVLDIEMPELKGTEVVKRLNAENRRIPILALSAYDDRQFILEMLGIGSSGYLVKDEAPGIIVNAVESISEGESGWVSNRIALRIALWLQDEMPQYIPFGENEKKLLAEIRANRRVYQIENQLNWPRSMVREEISKVAQAVREAIKNRDVLKAIRNREQGYSGRRKITSGENQGL